MLEKATVLTTLFTLVDDVMKGSAMIQDALERPGPAPRLTDSELVTIAIDLELIGEPREDHFFRLHQTSLLTFSLVSMNAAATTEESGIFGL